jgi:outer membrane protein OmpA-like peptidoglycan-associated protein
MAGDIGSSGKVAIYGIYFDFDKAEVKPESEPALAEIAKLLQADATLKLYVVGHTDNAGGYDHNMKLSQQRAEAVVRELTSKYRIAAVRLKPRGVGSLAPVTSNDTEEGRAKNRRVELVKQ